MGYYKSANGTMSFEPDDNETTLHLRSGYTLSDIIERAKNHFKVNDISLDQLYIESEHIQTKCIGYDLYDAIDWEYFLVINYTKE